MSSSVFYSSTPEQAERYGLRPLVRLVSWAVAGVAPQTMGIGPVPASATALERAGLTLADMDLIELNEAFAAQVLACTREWGFGRGVRALCRLTRLFVIIVRSVIDNHAERGGHSRPWLTHRK